MPKGRQLHLFQRDVAKKCLTVVKIIDSKELTNSVICYSFWAGSPFGPNEILAFPLHLS